MPEKTDYESDEKQAQPDLPAGMKMLDVSFNEEWREYVFEGEGVYRIEEPVRVYIKTHRDGLDSHRVVDRWGVVHYVPRTWKIIRWRPAKGSEEVVG